jgi:hypothetical protein
VQPPVAGRHRSTPRLVLGHVGQDDVLEPDLGHLPGWIGHGAVEAGEHPGLAFGLRHLHDGEQAVQLRGAPARSDQHPVAGENVVDVGAQAHPGAGQQDEVVADTLEVVHEAGGEHHRDVTVDSHSGEGGEELASGEGIERGERLVQQQDARPLAERKAERDLGFLPARQ